MTKDRKGIIFIDDDLKVKFLWNMYKLPIDSKIFNWSKKRSDVNTSTLLRANITLHEQIGDTYLDMSNFVKGYVWMNGHNLGRYWNVGPQQRLFCPGVWLK